MPNLSPQTKSETIEAAIKPETVNQTARYLMIA